MIRRGKYKDRPAIIVQSDYLRAAVLYEDGAKIASLEDLEDGRELLATKPGDTYKRLTRDGCYVNSECSAFDDMFPTIDPYTVTDGAFWGITYPDHGEVCRLPFSVRTEEKKAIFTLRSEILPYTFEKSVGVSDTGGIIAEYRITNLSDTPLDFIYAGHIMLKGEDGARLITTFAEDAPIARIFGADGCADEELARDRLTGFCPGNGAAYKFYYTEPMERGYFALRYHDGKELSFRFDEKKLPYLGVWLNNGEFQNIYTISPEPCTAPFDAPDAARARGYSSVIAPYRTFDFKIDIELTKATYKTVQE